MTFSAAARGLDGEHNFQIFVRSYDSELHSLDVPSDGIVRDVIDIARAAGLTAIEALAFQGQRLKADVQLSEAGICAESVLNEVLRAPRFKSEDSFASRYTISDNGNCVSTCLIGPLHLQILMDPRQREVTFRILYGGRLRFGINLFGDDNHFDANSIIKLSLDLQADVCRTFKNDELISEGRLSDLLRTGQGPRGLSDGLLRLKGLNALGAEFEIVN